MRLFFAIGGILIMMTMFLACQPYHQNKLPNPAAYQAHFPDMDADGDGGINWAEFKQYFPDANRHVFDALDVNKDSAVDHDEWHKFKQAHGLKDH